MACPLVVQCRCVDCQPEMPCKKVRAFHTSYISSAELEITNCGKVFIWVADICIRCFARNDKVGRILDGKFFKNSELGGAAKHCSHHKP